MDLFQILQNDEDIASRIENLVIIYLYVKNSYLHARRSVQELASKHRSLGTPNQVQGTIVNNKAYCITISDSYDRNF